MKKIKGCWLRFFFFFFYFFIFVFIFIFYFIFLSFLNTTSDEFLFSLFFGLKIFRREKISNPRGIFFFDEAWLVGACVFLCKERVIVRVMIVRA